jgi:hypothetical protein
VPAGLSLRTAIDAPAGSGPDEGGWTVPLPPSRPNPIRDHPGPTKATGRGCCTRGPSAPARPGGHPVATASPRRARGGVRSGSARDRPATDRPCRPAVHPPTRRSRRGSPTRGLLSAPNGASPSIFGGCRRPIPHNRYGRPCKIRPRRGGRTVPLPPVPTRRDRVRAWITRIRRMTNEARPRPGRDHPASGPRNGSIPRRGDGAAHLVPAANTRLRRGAPGLDPVRRFQDGARSPINRMPQLCNFLNAMRRFCGRASPQPLQQQGAKTSHKTLRLQYSSCDNGASRNGERG